MSFITQSQFDRIVTLPISLPETELRRQRSIRVATFPVAIGQRLEMRGLTVHLVKILTPGVIPSLDNTAMGLCSAGLIIGNMATSVIGNAFTNGLGAACWAADQPVIITAPGTYRLLAFNNSSNVDLAVVVTGSVKLFV